METIALKILELIWDKSDPLLIICILILGYWQLSTSKKLSKHLNPENRHPHPSCWQGEESYKLLCKALATQHDENREDHKQLFAKLDELKK